MKIAPSILTADFNYLSREIESINEADYLHLDIMDGHFVPNLSFGPHICQMLSEITSIPFDVHLMVTNPLNWIDKFNFKNTCYITIHLESSGYLSAINKIKKLGVKVGVSIKPTTHVEKLIHILDQIDLVLIMSVDPGFGSQTFKMSSLDKIKYLAEYRTRNHLDFEIEVDGGINLETAKLCKDSGATMLVAGSYIFNKTNRNQVIKDLRECE